MDINLSKIGLGALEERFDLAMKEVVQNILDPNMDPTKSREVIIKITIKPSKSNKKACEMFTEVKTKLEQRLPLFSSMGVGVDKNGEYNAREFVQRPLFPDLPEQPQAQEQEQEKEEDSYREIDEESGNIFSLRQR